MNRGKVKVATLFWRLAIRLIVSAFLVFTRFFEFLLPDRKPLPKQGIKILLTGSFYSDNWIVTHLRPLALAESVAEVRMIASTVVPDIEGVTPIYPDERLVRIIGSTNARLLTFARESFAWGPDIIGGFHLLLNGLVAQLIARIRVRRCMYFCGGGVREVEGGGFKTENRLFNKLGYPSKFVERRLIRSAGQFDYLITMGVSVKEYFLERGANGRVSVMPGGFDDLVFCPPQEKADFDLVTVGRLSPVKRVDMLIEAVAELHSQGKPVSVAIVGDGPSMNELRRLSEKCGVLDFIEFTGWQSDVEQWLKRSRVFTLTSESEGLSQAMIQAMLCGLPAVVSDVGDLKDLVEDGRNGLLITGQTAHAFAAAYQSILFDKQREIAMSQDARKTASRLEFKRVAAGWDDIFRAESSDSELPD